MKKILNIVAFVLLLTMVSCSSSPVGTWVETTGGSEEIGFTLNKDGSASSINMGYVDFNQWEKNGDLLILKGVRIRCHLSFWVMGLDSYIFLFVI